MSWAQAAASASLTAAAALSILFSPAMGQARARSLCVEEVAIAKGLRYLFNCDSYAHIRLARDPSGLLAGPDIVRQSRPGYVLLGAVAGAPFRLFNAVVVRIDSRFRWRAASSQPINPYYAGYLLLNWLALSIAAYLFLKLSGSASAFECAVLLPIVMLLLNGVTKGFFWTPHVQVFNVLIPLAAVAAGVRAAELRDRSRSSFLLLIGILSGLASLIYGSFLLVLATAIVAATLTVPRRRRWALLGTSLGAAGLFALPLVLWRWYVIHRTGQFFVHETATYHQFVWMYEAMQNGFDAFWAAGVLNLGRFARTLPSLLFPAILLASVWSVRARSRRKVSAVPDSLRVSVLAFLIVAIPFFALMGFYAPRLTWQLAPALLVLAARLLDSMLRASSPAVRRGVCPALAAASAAWAIYLVATDQTYFLGIAQ